MAETLGRTPDGELVFGWCSLCLAMEGCEPVEGASVDLKLKRSPSMGRKARKVRREFVRWMRKPRSLEASRRLAAMGISGLMAAWALILAFVGGLKLGGPGRSWGAFLLMGAGLMALLSLAFWLGVIGRGGRLRIGLKILQVAAAVVGFGTIAWGIVRPNRAQNPIIVAVAAAALAVSWSARRYEKARFVARKAAKTTVL